MANKSKVTKNVTAKGKVTKNVTSKEGEPEWISPTEFARRLKVNRNAVVEALARGRVTFRQEGKRKLVDWLPAQEEWKKHGSAIAKAKAEKLKSKSKDAEAPRPRWMPDPDADDREITIAEAERRQKLFKAKEAELSYREKAGELIPVDKVKREAFQVARKVRDAIMNIPPKLAHELAAETSPHAIELKLNEAFSKALERLSKDL